MIELHVVGYRVHQVDPHPGEERDPAGDMLVVLCKNPLDPDDPSEYGFHIQFAGLANRKEMYGLTEYAEVIERELRDAERLYCPRLDVDYGPHPLAAITEHYFEGPPQRMRSFAPGYVVNRLTSTLPFSTDGLHRLAVDTALSGLEDVKESLRAPERQTYPCQGMTNLCADSVDKRGETLRRIEEQTQEVKVVTSRALDEVCQFVTDQARRLDEIREGFVNRALMEGNVPEIMRRRSLDYLTRQAWSG